MFNKAKEAIKNFLDAKAANDPLFAETYKKPNKNLDECINYIMNQARKSGNAVMAKDEDVFNLAVHYYDEDDIKNIKPVPGMMSVGAKVELTEEDKEKAKQAAIEAYKQAEINQAGIKAEELAKKKAHQRAEKLAEFEKKQLSLF